MIEKLKQAVAGIVGFVIMAILVGITMLANNDQVYDEFCNLTNFCAKDEK